MNEMDRSVLIRDPATDPLIFLLIYFKR